MTQTFETPWFDFGFLSVTRKIVGYSINGGPFIEVARSDDLVEQQILYFWESRESGLHVYQRGGEE